MACRPARRKGAPRGNRNGGGKRVDLPVAPRPSLLFIFFPHRYKCDREKGIRKRRGAPPSVSGREDEFGGNHGAQRGDIEWRASRLFTRVYEGRGGEGDARQKAPHCTSTVGSRLLVYSKVGSWQAWSGIAEDAESMSLPHTIKMLDFLGKQYNVNLSQDMLTTVGEERGDWCWHVHRRTRSVKNYKPSLE